MANPPLQREPDATPSKLSFTEVHVDEHLVHVALAGDLDVDSARDIELQFTARTSARHRPVIVDITQVNFISSYGIGILVACSKACALRKYKFIVVGPQPKIREALTALRLNEVLKIAATVDEAKALIGA